MDAIYTREDGVTLGWAVYLTKVYLPIADLADTMYPFVCQQKYELTNSSSLEEGLGAAFTLPTAPALWWAPASAT